MFIRNIVWRYLIIRALQCVENYEIKETVINAVLSGIQGVKHSLDVELLDVAIDGFAHNVFYVLYGF